MATPRSKSTFSRVAPSSATIFSAPSVAGVRAGPNGAAFVSSGIPDLDRILGGGFLVGSLVMVMEDTDAPHHLLLLRCFLSQGALHGHSMLYASPSSDPRAFLGTIPSPLSYSASSASSSPPSVAPNTESGLRIAWQYKKYFEEHKTTEIGRAKENELEYSNDFDLRKPLERKFLNNLHVDCVSNQDVQSLTNLHNHCSTFLSKLLRKDGGNTNFGRIAIQSLCAPECQHFDKDWDMVSFIVSLKALLRASNAVSLVTFPSSVLSSSFSKRWQHLADTLISVRAIPDDDKHLASLLTGYQDMVGFLHLHKVAQFNSQVPVIPEASTFSLKLKKRKTLVLEQLNQAPVEASSGTSYSTPGSCSSSSSKGSLDF